MKSSDICAYLVEGFQGFKEMGQVGLGVGVTEEGRVGRHVLGDLVNFFQLLERPLLPQDDQAYNHQY